MQKDLLKFICPIILLLTTSSNIYANIYIPIPSLKKPKISPFTKAQALKTDEFDTSTKQLLEEGYIPIKSQIFNGRDDFRGYEHVVAALEKRADRMGAQIVLFSNDKPTGSVDYYSFSAPFPQKSIMQSNFDNSNDNSYASSNSSLIQTAPRYNAQKEYIVSYFYKFESITGIYPIDLSDLDKSKTGQLEGIKAKVISKNSPAFGTILEDDIILKINNNTVRDVSNFVDMSNYLNSGTVEFEILRKGQKLTKEISLE
ncbi:PDZ domain-containing protein [Acinetobacter halotolerans]|uniref:PDZ domain-containing protein n=1 Tax=Acinetobacter halotolerans TaxID=1752076 RepID=A0A4Q6X841_9GAMM|nr:PDZ domain-containing protein [Acinetobacter halotolerans]RZF49686.1 PDZ domain-containing protein [Acinetobacter halotolerans]